MNRMAAGLVVMLLSVVVVSPSVANGTTGGGQDDDHDGWRLEDGLRYESGSGDFGLDFHGLLQFRTTAINPELGDTSESFDINRLQLGMTGNVYQNWEFGVQVNFADGSENETNLLEDAFIRYSKHSLAQVWFGQGKVQFGRQAMTPSGKLQFVDRSIASDEFLATGERSDNRDVGIALMGLNHAKTYAYSIGIYNGNGINKDEKDNSDFMASARLVAMPFGEFPLAEVSADRPKDPRLAIGISVLSLTRGTGALEEKIRDTTAGLEFAFAYRGLNMNGEFFTRSGDEPLGFPGNEIDSDGWYFQGGYLFADKLEVALRYAEVLRELIDTDEIEKGIAINYYVRRHNLKAQLDFRELEFEAPPSSPNINRDVIRFQLQFGF